MDVSEIVAEGGRPVSAEVRDRLLEPLVTATCTALGEMAGTEVAVRAALLTALHHTPGDVAAVVDLVSATGGTLVMGFPSATAAALAGRMLAGLTQQIGVDLIGDCVGEIANVVAGQAKAILAGTPYAFACSVPRVVGPNYLLPPTHGGDDLVVVFHSGLGDFAIQLSLKL